MARKKLDAFEQQEQELSNVARALGHPARIKIIKLLMSNNGQSCQTIVDQLPLSQSTVSQHLRELRQSGLVEGQHEGTSVIYSVNREKLNNAQKMFADLFYSKSVLQPTLF